MTSLVHSGQEAVVPTAQAEKPAAHTPGPWTHHDYSTTGAVWAGNEFIASVYPSPDSETWDGVSDWPRAAECKANARLIAAAPELLDVADHPLLREVLGYVEDCAPDEIMGKLRHWQDEQRAAIAKATGEAS